MDVINMVPKPSKKDVRKVASSIIQPHILDRKGPLALIKNESKVKKSKSKPSKS